MTVFYKVTGNTPKPIEVIAPCDDAVDRHESSIEYYEKDFDQCHLRLDGEPAKFKIRPLSRDELEGIDVKAWARAGDETNWVAYNQARRYLAFYAGCVGIKAMVQAGHEEPTLQDLERGDWTEVVPTGHKLEIGRLVLLISQRRYDPPPKEDPGKS